MKSQQREALYPTPVPPIAVDFSPRSGPQKGPGFSPNERVARHAERLAFVEHVCGVLIESRSGRPPLSPWDIFEGPVEDAFYAVPVYDLMPEWAFDLMPKGGFIPSFVLGRAGLGRVLSPRSGRQHIAPGFSPGSRDPTYSRSRLDAGDNAFGFGTRGYFNNHGPPNGPSHTLGRALLGKSPFLF